MPIEREDTQFLGHMRDRAPILVALFFILSMMAGSQANNPFYVGLWVVFGVLGLVAIWWSFPNTYLYGTWLLFVYIFTNVGMVVLRSDLLSLPQAIGIFILFEGLAVYVMYNFILQVRTIRDLYRTPERHTPLGLWAVGVMGFFVLSNISAYSWVTWAFVGGSLDAYFVAEIVMVALIILIFWHPEKNIMEDVARTKAISKRRGPLARDVKGDVRTARADKATGSVKRAKDGTANEEVATGASAGAGDKCPVCGGKMVTEHRACPTEKCLYEAPVGWCVTGEHYIVSCPECNKPHVYGEGTCPHCDVALVSGLACPSCSKMNPISDWPLVPEEDAGDAAGGPKGDKR